MKRNIEKGEKKEDTSAELVTKDKNCCWTLASGAPEAIRQIA